MEQILVRHVNGCVRLLYMVPIEYKQLIETNIIISFIAMNSFNCEFQAISSATVWQLVCFGHN